MILTLENLKGRGKRIYDILQESKLRKDLAFTNMKEHLTSTKRQIRGERCNDKKNCHVTSILIILIMINKYWTFTMSVI